MFSGIVEAIGEVHLVVPTGPGARLRVHAGGLLEQARQGESIAVSGVCLTMATVADQEFEVDLSGETLRRTTLGRLGPGDLVNLERPLRLDQRLGGHLVQGHVDGIGTVTALCRNSHEAWMEFQPPEELRRYLVEKGSVAVDGVSLTVAGVRTDGGIAIALIPHTLAVTTLGQRRSGDRVNLEVDVIAKYLEKLL